MIASAPYLLAVLTLVALIGGSAWYRQSEHRPAHAGAGTGALTVAQLCAAYEPAPADWPTLDPDAPCTVDRSMLSEGFDSSLPTMLRLLDALHRL